MNLTCYNGKYVYDRIVQYYAVIPAVGYTDKHSVTSGGRRQGSVSEVVNVFCACKSLAYLSCKFYKHRVFL